MHGVMVDEDVNNRRTSCVRMGCAAECDLRALGFVVIDDANRGILWQGGGGRGGKDQN